MGAETPFFQTRMGSTFYNHNVPRIADALERIATALEKLVPPVEPDDPAQDIERPNGTTPREGR